MRSRRAFLPLASLILAFGPACSSSEEAAATPADDGGEPVDLASFMKPTKSCAYTSCPGLKCAEVESGYVCQNLGPWAEIPHADSCGGWDGSYPTPVVGQCAASAPTGDALAKSGAYAGDPKAHVLPGGRIIKPAGADWAFDEADLDQGSTTALAAIPGTAYVLTVDAGGGAQVVRAVDTAKVASGQTPVTSVATFSAPLNGSIVAVSATRAYVAIDAGYVQALAFDAATGAVTADDAASIPLPPSQNTNGDPASWYTSSIAASPDGKRLAVAAVEETRVLVYDIDPASATYRQKLGEVDLGAKDTFQIAFDPYDPTGHFAYVSVWGGRKVVEIDLGDPTAPALARKFATDKDPQGMAFLDARWLAVANDFGETISLVDRTTGTVTSVPVDFEGGVKGLDVSGLAYDAAHQRLYAVLAGINAVGAYDVDLSASPPKLTPAGRFGTPWWPGGVVVHEDGSLSVAALRGHGTGPNKVSAPAGEGGGKGNARGGIQHLALPTAAELAQGATDVAGAIAVGERQGYPTVTCPAGVKDFPIPTTNTEGPSPVIKHVFLVVRENKTFDSLLGDLPGLDGEPTYAFKAKPADMDRIWKNFRDAGRGFVIADNFYTAALESTQGHTWTAYGRSSDFDERTTLTGAWGTPGSGIFDEGKPEEGSSFDWLQKNQVPYDIFGEVVGNPASIPEGHNPIDVRYPGGPFQNILYNDDEKACYVAGRLRVACDVGSFTYVTLPNDHTQGTSPKNPSPETYCAVNDDATGMFLDALAHSPLWKESLVFITEDDPQQGGDHVDYNRVPLVVVSPWVKRGYVTKTHFGIAGIHKMVAHVFGLPYPNLEVKHAGLPLDMFTSTPDYTPFTYTPRQEPLTCGVAATRVEQALTDGWSFDEADAQPGLDEQVTRWMRGQQATEVTPAIRRHMAQSARMRR